MLAFGYANLNPGIRHNQSNTNMHKSEIIIINILFQD